MLTQPGRAYRARWADRESWLWGPLRLSATEGGRWWQVGAFRSAEAAETATRRLDEALGADTASNVTEAPDGLLRVRVRWREAEPADPAAVLAGIGFAGAFAVPASGALRIEAATSTISDITGEVVLEAEDGWPILVDGRRYHGRLRVRAAGDELLVINQLNLESYLKGVVPAEMGPAQFPQLDALKAQAVAARTYAIAHLGDAEAEGYDLCATPACQVYAGVDAQHPLSDRAVDETAGLIATYGGEPIDAMYTSTCGGHTEDAALLFSGRAQPYLRGVPCAWDRPISLAGSIAPQSFRGESEFRAHLAGRALGLAAAAPPQQVVERVAGQVRRPQRDGRALADHSRAGRGPARRRRPRRCDGAGRRPRRHGTGRAGGPLRHPARGARRGSSVRGLAAASGARRARAFRGRCGATAARRCPTRQAPPSSRARRRAPSRCCSRCRCTAGGRRCGAACRR